MFRKLLLSVGLALGALTMTAAAPRADAHPPRHHHFRVFYRASCYEPWCFYGRYDCREEAFHAAHHLRHRGFEVDIRG